MSTSHLRHNFRLQSFWKVPFKLCEWIEKVALKRPENEMWWWKKEKEKVIWKRISENNENWFPTFWLRIVLKDFRRSPTFSGAWDYLCEMVRQREKHAVPFRNQMRSSKVTSMSYRQALRRLLIALQLLYFAPSFVLHFVSFSLMPLFIMHIINRLIYSTIDM